MPVRCSGCGGVAERSNAAVSKTVSGFRVRRGFKSLPLRFTATERCPSGLRSATGNRVGAERCLAGSNPALSAPTRPAQCRSRALRDLEGRLHPQLAVSGPEAIERVGTLSEPADDLTGLP